MFRKKQRLQTLLMKSVIESSKHSKNASVGEKKRNSNTSTTSSRNGSSNFVLWTVWHSCRCLLHISHLLPKGSAARSRNLLWWVAHTHKPMAVCHMRRAKGEERKCWTTQSVLSSDIVTSFHRIAFGRLKIWLKVPQEYKLKIITRTSRTPSEFIMPVLRERIMKSRNSAFLLLDPVPRHHPPLLLLFRERRLVENLAEVPYPSKRLLFVLCKRHRRFLLRNQGLQYPAPILMLKCERWNNLLPHLHQFL